jgi:4-aminobutyrate aminotransferase-like enzyme
MSFWEPDIHTTTFLTNPLIHSAAIAAIEVMQEEQIWQNSAELGKVLLSVLLSELEDHPLVGEIRGKGLYVGIEMVNDKKKKTPAKEEVKKVQSKAKEMGLVIGLAGYYGNVIRICPPLTISRSELETALEKLIYIFKHM